MVLLLSEVNIQILSLLRSVYSLSLIHGSLPSVNQGVCADKISFRSCFVASLNGSAPTTKVVYYQIFIWVYWRPLRLCWLAVTVWSRHLENRELRFVLKKKIVCVNTASGRLLYHSLISLSKTWNVTHIPTCSLLRQHNILLLLIMPLVCGYSSVCFSALTEPVTLSIE